MCYWGSLEFDLLDAVRAARWLHYKNRFIHPRLSLCAGWTCAAQMFDFIHPRNGRFSEYGRLLGDLVGVAQLFEKSEPKDSIYAILGLLDRLEPPEGDIARLLEVDYTKSVSEILQDATRYALCQIEDLWALRMVNHRSNDITTKEGFSTWTVRADLQYITNEDTKALLYWSEASLGLQAPSLLLDMSYGADVLLGQGITADHVLEATITCGGDYWHEDVGYHAWLISAKAIVLKHRTLWGQETARKEYIEMAFCLTGSKAINGLRARQEDLLVLAKYLEDLPVTTDSATSDEVEFETRRDLGWARVSKTSYLDYCLGRRFFITATGRMGLGPGSIEADDIVVVLRGGRWPFILRKEDNHYLLLGSAYVHGIMHGEAVQLEKAKGTPEQVFPIR